MELTVEIDFEDCLKACLDYAEKNMTLSEIVENKQDWLDYYRTSVNALSRIVRANTDGL